MGVAVAGVGCILLLNVARLESSVVYNLCMSELLTVGLPAAVG